MSFHNDYDAWFKMNDPQHCPVCQNLPMPPGMVDIVARYRIYTFISIPELWMIPSPVSPSITGIRLINMRMANLKHLSPQCE